MKTIITLLFVMFSVFLVGCETVPAATTKTVFKVPQINDELVRDCKITAPPKVAGYVALTPDEKERTQYEYSSALIGNLSECNKQMSGIRKWFTEQRKIYEAKTP